MGLKKEIKKDREKLKIVTTTSLYYLDQVNYNTYSDNSYTPLGEYN